MATTKRIKNPIKSNKAVSNLIEYVLNPAKTTDEKCVYHGSMNCSVIGTAEQFIRVRKEWCKESGNLAYHFIQSFSPGETTPSEAHQCGSELAEVLFAKDGYQVLFATHLDREHLHNHFVVNSVNLITGKKLQTDHAFINRMRAENDRICRCHNLSVVNGSQKGKTYAEWKVEKDGGFSWRGAIKQDIDVLIIESSSFKELLSKLQDCGYTLSRRGQYLRLSPPGTDTFFRFSKLGKGYSEEELVDKIFYQGRYIKPKMYSSYPKRKHHRTTLNSSFGKIKKRSRLQGLYYVYIYRLRNLSRSSKTHKKLPMVARQDLLRLKQLSTDMCLLSDNKIHTVLDLSEFYYSLDKQIKNLYSQRSKLRNMLQQCSSQSEELHIRSQIDNINNTLSVLRNKMKACERIYSRSEEISETNKQLTLIIGGDKTAKIYKASEKNLETKGNDNNVSRS